jgi:CheY-like chemotaxis protein/HPt (histidine-containing phosphotransfer) domain-containing protein
VELIFLQSGPPEAGFYVFLREIGSSIVADRALIRAKDAAVASNRAKTDFLAKISHDIRTPLNAILGAADLLSQTSLTFDQSGYVHMFQRNCRRLVALINDFLDFSQIEAGAIHIEKASFQIREIVDDAVATFREAAARKAIALGVYIDPMVPRWLMGDSLRIQQVLVNLLSNALKFTAEGRVEVRATVLETVGSDGQRLRCEVLDTGPGVALQDQDKIFMKFIQLPNQIAGQRGTGLGLTICRDLVELMGGEIGVSSQAGGGSSFHFSLPLEAAPQASGQPGATASQQATSSPAASQLPAPGDAVRILVAEDNEDNRLLLEHYLRSEPVTLRFAFTGREAVDVVQLGEEFDLILMDIDMPVLNGHGAAKAIRAWEDSRGVSTPIVALSADAMSEAVRSSLEAGCVAHVAKPVDRGTLLKTIRRYAKAHGARSIPAPAAAAAVSEQVQALVPQYLASKHKQIEAARESLLSRDFGPIRRFGHDLKGTGRGYGFPAIEELGQQIEKAAGEADVDRIAGQLNALHRYVAESGAAATAATDSVREAR